MLVKLGKRWLHCDGCRHSVMIDPDGLARRHQLDMLTPLLTILQGDALHGLRRAKGMLLAVNRRGSSAPIGVLSH
jgi:hypothetical protein